NSSVSPGAGARASSSCSERNFAIGERSSPLSSRTTYDRPVAPRSSASASVRLALVAVFLCERLECPELGARVRPRHAQEPARVGAGEDAELRAARELGRVLELEGEARVGVFGAAEPVRPRDSEH